MKTLVRLPLVLALALLFSCAAQAQVSGKIDDPGLRALQAKEGSRLLVLDVRTAEEHAEGHIPGALLMPYDEIPLRFAERDKARPLVVYCRSGRRSAIAAESLRKLGYTRVYDLGGLESWKGPWERD